jgi:pimeloyl-ACP methyl ester carboxylesterase
MMTPEPAKFKQPMQPWPSLAEYGRQINLFDLNLFYFEAGERNRSTLLMIHGLGDEADTWRHVFLPLAENYHTLALDLPGFGRSGKPEVDYTPQFMMETIIEFLDQLEITGSILMGSSLGGILAHGLALNNPTRVNGLILVGGALLQSKPMGDMSMWLMRLPLLGEWLYTRLRKDPDAAFNSLSNVYHALEGLPESDRKFLYTRVNQRVWSDGQRRGYFSTLRNLTPWVKQIQADLSERLMGLEMPTLILRGEFDGLFSETNAKGIAATQPYAEKATIEEAGHLPHQENPRDFLNAVKPWLEERY